VFPVKNLNLKKSSGWLIVNWFLYLPFRLLIRVLLPDETTDAHLFTLQFDRADRTACASGDLRIGKFAQ
jgi:hypothetical protein